jgi:hypothetical protein
MEKSDLTEERLIEWEQWVRINENRAPLSKGARFIWGVPETEE